MSFVRKVSAAIATMGSMAYVYKRFYLYPHGDLFTVLKRYIILLLGSKYSMDIRRLLQTPTVFRNERQPAYLCDMPLVIYHSASDPHSYLLLQGLQKIVATYRVRLEPKIVSPAVDGYFAGHSTEYNTQREWALRDSEYCSRTFDLRPPPRPVASLRKEDCANADRSLIRFLFELRETSGEESSLSARQSLEFLEHALKVSEALFKGEVPAFPTNPGLEGKVKVELMENHTNLKGKGHYLTGLVFLAPEFYWGVDRLLHLERRLLELDLERVKVQSNGAPLTPHFAHNYRLRCSILNKTNMGSIMVRRPSHSIKLFYSFRSPYSQLALERAAAIASFWGVALECKPVLPMVMRGLRVPRAKGRYIIMDASREARELDAFGFHHVPSISPADPVGPATIRAFVVWEYADQRGRGLDFMLTFSRAVWHEGVNAASDRGMKTIVDRVDGLPWEQCSRLLKENGGLGGSSWKCIEARNQKELTVKYNLWGVPSFVYGNFCTWGQDRLRALEDAIFYDVTARSPALL